MVNLSKNTIFVCILSIIVYIVFLILVDLTPNRIENAVYALSAFGWVLWCYIIATWKKESGEYFSLYNILFEMSIPEARSLLVRRNSSDLCARPIFGEKRKSHFTVLIAVAREFS